MKLQTTVLTKELFSFESWLHLQCRTDHLPQHEKHSALSMRAQAMNSLDKGRAGGKPTQGASWLRGAGTALRAGLRKEDRSMMGFSNEVGRLVVLILAHICGDLMT